MAERGQAKEGSVSLGSVLIICAAIVNLYWTFCNWRIRTNDRNQHLQFLSDAAELKQEAQNCLNRARKIVAMASIEHDFAVCKECQKITSKYITEHGITICIDCAAAIAMKG